ncbi:MAG: hypothetical protein J7K00_01690 [Candidatus Diapherotrites archaeon]|nr:hypothetical protein [Candidatus Diapherotrites archaeon]
MGNYVEQYERMMRWYGRFKQINTGIPHKRSSDYYLDDIYAFFLNCYNLKDWILNDDSIKVDKKILEDKITKNNYLRVCADLANWLKHLYLKKTRKEKKEHDNIEKRKDITPKIRRNVTLNLGSNEPTIEFKIDIRSKEDIMAQVEVCDAFKVATKCVEAWDKFIDENIKPLKK